MSREVPAHSVTSVIILLSFIAAESWPTTLSVTRRVR
jgi:hypothetical protein